MSKSYKLKSKVWLYNTQKAAWHFLTLPKKESEEIKKKFSNPATSGVKTKRGWGSIPVEVSIGKTKWETSIFPDTKSKSYILPLKKEIRDKEDIYEGDTVDFKIEIKR